MNKPVTQQIATAVVGRVVWHLSRDCGAEVPITFITLRSTRMIWAKPFISGRLRWKIFRGTFLVIAVEINVLWAQRQVTESETFCWVRGLSWAAHGL